MAQGGSLEGGRPGKAEQSFAARQLDKDGVDSPDPPYPEAAWWTEGQAKDSHWAPVSDPWGLMTSKATNVPLEAMVKKPGSTKLVQDGLAMANLLRGHVDRL